MKTDAIQQAEQFIDRVVAPLREAEAHARRRARPSESADEALAAARRALGRTLDVDALEDVARQFGERRRSEAEQRRRVALADAEEFEQRLSAIAPWVPPIDSGDTVIDEVTFIRSFAGQGSVIDSNIAPGDNWARYELRSDGFWDGTGRLSFFTLWQNPLEANAFVAPQVNVAVNARLSCDASFSGMAAWFGMEAEASAAVELRTTLWGMSGNQMSIVDDRELGRAAVSGGFFGDDSSSRVHINELVSASGIVVAARAFVLIEVELATVWEANSGASVHFDAASGSRRMFLSQIIIPGVAGPQPQPGQITLTASSVPFPGGASVTLSWLGADGASVDVFRNGAKVATTENDGVWSEAVGPGSYTYRLCETQSSRCSNDASVLVA